MRTVSVGGVICSVHQVPNKNSCIVGIRDDGGNRVVAFRFTEDENGAKIGLAFGSRIGRLIEVEGYREKESDLALTATWAETEDGLIYEYDQPDDKMPPPCKPECKPECKREDVPLTADECRKIAEGARGDGQGVPPWVWRTIRQAASQGKDHVTITALDDKTSKALSLLGFVVRHFTPRIASLLWSTPPFPGAENACMKEEATDS